MNHATTPPIVEARTVRTSLDLSAFITPAPALISPDPQVEADRIGYEAGYAGRVNPSPYDDSIPAATFRSRCVGWVRGHEDRIAGKPHPFGGETDGRAEDDYRPTFDDVAIISAAGRAEWEGFSIGVEGIAGNPPADYPLDQREAWVRGHRAGFREYEEIEMARWDREPDSPPEPHHAELVENCGSDVARNFVSTGDRS